MNECLLRGSEGAYKPQSRVDLGKGSHSTCQRLVRLVIRSVQNPYERLVFVQAQREGVSSSWQPTANLYAPACEQATPARQPVQIATLAPPALRKRAGPTLKFSPLFQRQSTKGVFYGIRNESWTGQPVPEQHADS